MNAQGVALDLSRANPATTAAAIEASAKGFSSPTPVYDHRKHVSMRRKGGRKGGAWRRQRIYLPARAS